jgi:MFS transporter, FSR family, fosmidomycin resistance protein
MRTTRSGQCPPPASGGAAAVQKTRLFLLTLAHFLIDTYATMLAPVLPLVIAKMGLSYASAGVLGTVMSIVSLSQPLMGVWADRMRRRYLVVAGVVMAALFGPLLGVASSYGAIIVVLALGGVGVSAFHPQGFSLAGELSGPRRSFGLSLFIFGGTLALGATPLWVTAYADRFGLERLPFIALPGLAVALVVFRFLPLENPRIQKQDLGTMWKSLARKWGPLTLITVIVILRSVTSIAFGTFLAVLGQERGLAAGEAGRVPLSVYQTSGVVGSLIAGYLADRVDPRPLVWGSILLAAPALYGYLLTDGWFGYALLGLGGGLILASNSVLVAVAQEQAPEHAALASSLPLGLSWGVAGLTLPLVGYAADQIGMAETLKYLALLPIPTALLSLFLPGGADRKRGD